MVYQYTRDDDHLRQQTSIGFNIQMFRPQPMYHGDSQYNGGTDGSNTPQSQQQQQQSQQQQQYNNGQQQAGLSYQPQVAMPPIRRFSTEADIHHAAPLQLDDHHQPPSSLPSSPSMRPLSVASLCFPTLLQSASLLVSPLCFPLRLPFRLT